jgi:hypothetical protein
MKAAHSPAGKYRIRARPFISGGAQVGNGEREGEGEDVGSGEADSEGEA